jgi:branched-chain amino acid transport system ATP-binding protein
VRSDPKVIAAYLGVDDEAEIDIPEVRKDVHGGAKTVSAKARPTRSSRTPRTTKSTRTAKAPKGDKGGRP